jgi:hypothetical protein
MNQNKGFFATIIIALIISMIILFIGLNVKYINSEEDFFDNIITTKELEFERNSFEYNLYYLLKYNLDNSSKESQDLDIIKQKIDLILSTYLLENEFYNLPNTSLLIKVEECFPNDCVFYSYSILNSIKKNIIYKNKEITIGIPMNYTISNMVIINV